MVICVIANVILTEKKKGYLGMVSLRYKRTFSPYQIWRIEERVPLQFDRIRYTYALNKFTKVKWAS